MVNTNSIFFGHKKYFSYIYLLNIVSGIISSKCTCTQQIIEGREKTEASKLNFEKIKSTLTL